MRRIHPAAHQAPAEPQAQYQAPDQAPDHGQAHPLAGGRRWRGMRGAVTAASAIAVAALVSAALTGCTSTLGYAALVNGQAISQTSLNQELADISANSKYVALINQPGGSGPVAGSTTGTYSKAFVALLLDQQIRFELIRQALVAKKAMPTADQITAAKMTVSQAFPAGYFTAFPVRYQNVLAIHQAEADSFVKVDTANKPADALNQFYQAHLSDYTSEECVRHILIADKDTTGQLDYTASLADANRIKALLDGGGDFAALAKQYSQDNQGTNGGTAAVGGALPGSAADGCMTSQDLQQLVTAFAQAAVALPVNQVSSPVKTQFGYHLIEVTKRVVEPLDSNVTADIQQRLALTDLARMESQAKVKVNPEFGSFDSAASANGQTGVRPPLVPNLLGTTTTSTTAGASTSGSTSGG